MAKKLKHVKERHLYMLHILIITYLHVRQLLIDTKLSINTLPAQIYCDSFICSNVSTRMETKGTKRNIPANSITTDRNTSKAKFVREEWKGITLLRYEAYSQR